jgi:hypothetical protein
MPTTIKNEEPGDEEWGFGFDSVDWGAGAGQLQTRIDNTDRSGAQTSDCPV